MWVKSYSHVYPGVTKSDVWRLWVDVNHWPTWDKDLEYCQLKGNFEQGNHFILKPRGGPKVKLFLSEVIEHKTFTDYCCFFGATMYDIHELEETPTGLRITNTIKVTGPLRFIWIHLVAKNVFKNIPIQTDALVKLARSQHA